MCVHKLSLNQFTQTIKIIEYMKWAIIYRFILLFHGVNLLMPATLEAILEEDHYHKDTATWWHQFKADK